MKIRAAVLNASPVAAPYAQTKPLAIEEVELAPPGPGEVLVRVRAAGLCHSDLSVIDGNRPRPVPMVLGHEAAGEVVEPGAGVQDLKRGDRVIMVFVPSCGHCAPCSEGRPALCEPGNAANGVGELLGGGRRLSAKGKAVNHHVGVSAFAEHAVISRHSLVKIEADIPHEIAALFGCAVLTGVGAARRHDHDRRPRQSGPYALARAGPARRRGADAERLLCRKLHSRPRHPALHRPLPARQAAGRQAADQHQRARRDQRGFRRARRGPHDPARDPDVEPARHSPALQIDAPRHWISYRLVELRRCLEWRPDRKPDAQVGSDQRLSACTECLD